MKHGQETPVKMIDENGEICFSTLRDLAHKYSLNYSMILRRYYFGRRYRDMKSLIVPPFSLPLEDSVTAKDLR